MLGAIEMNELLKRFKYKKGWRFEVIDFDYSMVNFVMMVSYPAKDAFDPTGERDIIVGSRRPFTAPYNEEEFWARLLSIIEYMERHEARE